MPDIYLIKKSAGMADKLDGIKGYLNDFAGKTVCIKLHMGELGNKTYINPAIVKKVISVLKSMNAKPFLFDSTTVYHGSRHTVKGYIDTAKQNGFTQDAIGCPVIVSDSFVVRKTDHLKARLCKDIANAECMIVLSHVKGHECCGFGGAIKNLGMGAMTPATKAAIHNGAQPLLMKSKCIGCGICEKSCPNKCITMRKKHPSFKTKLLVRAGCTGCDICIDSCKQGALKPRVLHFDALLAEAASAAIKGKPCYFVNVIENITKHCDCYSNPGEIIAPDIGIVFGDDIVAVEKASVDLVNKAKKDAFLNANHKDPYGQINAAEKLGMGKQEYNLVEIK